MCTGVCVAKPIMQTALRWTSSHTAVDSITFDRLLGHVWHPIIKPNMWRCGQDNVDQCFKKDTIKNATPAFSSPSSCPCWQINPTNEQSLTRPLLAIIKCRGGNKAKMLISNHRTAPQWRPFWQHCSINKSWGIAGALSIWLPLIRTYWELLDNSLASLKAQRGA